MITFTELLERAKSEYIAIHTQTEKQAITLLSELDKKGYEWLSGQKLTYITFYADYKENICYSFYDFYGELLDKKVKCGPLGFYQDKGYTVIECGDINFKENA